MRLPSILKKSVALLVLAGFALGVTGCQPAAAPPAAKAPAMGGKTGPAVTVGDGEKSDKDQEKPADEGVETPDMPADEAAPGEQAGSGETTGAEPSNPGDAQ